jgi:hypothetical protein
MVFEVGFCFKEIHHASWDDIGSVSGSTEFEVLVNDIFQLLLQLN